MTKPRRSTFRKYTLGKEGAYILWLMTNRDWSRREAEAYARKGPKGLAIEQGRMARERHRATLADHIRDGERRMQERSLNARGIERLWINCENPRCRLSARHSGPHDYGPQINPYDLEEGDAY